MSPRRRWLIIGGLLAATLAAAAWVRIAVDDPDSGISAEAPARSVRKTPPATPSAGDSPSVKTVIDLEKLAARTPGTPQRDPFALPAPKISKRGPVGSARAPVAPPPPPSAPPVPFTYMGKLRSGSDTAVFLTQGDRNLVIREGDTIDSTYRVEQIADSAITLTYLPLDERQTIPIGGSPP